MNPNTSQLLELLREKKYKEARAELETLVTGDLTPEEKGAVYTALFQTYLEASNALDEEYIHELEQALAALKGLSKGAKKLDEDKNLEDLRSKLKNQ